MQNVRGIWESWYRAWGHCSLGSMVQLKPFQICVHSHQHIAPPSLTATQSRLLSKQICPKLLLQGNIKRAIEGMADGKCILFLAVITMATNKVLIQFLIASDYFYVTAEEVEPQGSKENWSRNIACIEARVYCNAYDIEPSYTETALRSNSPSWHLKLFHKPGLQILNTLYLLDSSVWDG